MIDNFVETFADTDLGKYYINAAVGKDFGNLKSIKK